MCGGAGTRLERGEKPLFEIGGAPMIERVLGALEASRVETVHAVTSPKAPETARRLEGRIERIETAGDGYVADLAAGLERIDPPAVTVAADLPLLAAAHVNRAIEAHEAGGSLTVCVPAELKRRLGVSVDRTDHRDGAELSPTGLNVVGGAAETVRVSYDARLAVNVNRPADAIVAEALLGGRTDGP
jgi:adenosylcobinamide-phosphate guanylyltransferase